MNLEVTPCYALTIQFLLNVFSSMVFKLSLRNHQNLSFMLRLLYTFAFRKHIRLQSLYQKANNLEIKAYKDITLFQESQM